MGFCKEEQQWVEGDHHELSGLNLNCTTITIVSDFIFRSHDGQMKYRNRLVDVQDFSLRGIGCFVGGPNQKAWTFMGELIAGVSP